MPSFVLSAFFVVQKGLPPTLLDAPIHGEQRSQRGLLFQFAFDFGDELLAAAINIVLGIEERPALLVSLMA